MVTNIPPSRRSRKKAETRARIVAEAMRLFGERGIDRVTVDEIARVADVGKGTVYNYFQTKEDIALAFMADVERTVQAQLRISTGRKRDVVAILTSYVRKEFELKAPHHAFVRVFLAHMFLRTEQFLPYMVEIQKTIDPALEALFTSLRERRLIRDDVPVSQLVMVFKTMQLGLMSLWAVEGPPFVGAERTMKQEIRLFCEGLGAKA
jgi:AcrR family transcriptional regulator